MVSSYQEKIAKISPELRNFLESDELVSIIENISALAKLNLKQTSQLTYCVGQVLLGEIPVNQFKETIEKSSLFSLEQINLINSLVNTKIFNQWKSQLEKITINPLSSLTEGANRLKRITIPQTQTFNQTPNAIKPVAPIDKTTSRQSITQPIATPFENPIPNELPQINEETREPIPVSITASQVTPPDIKPVNIPNVSQAEREEMQNKLLAAIQSSKEKFTPKIVAEMEKIEAKPKTKAPTDSSSKLPVAQISEKGEIVSGQKEIERSQPDNTPRTTPYIFETKLKPETEKPPKSTSPIAKKPIPYRKFTPKNPFGKA